MSRPVVHSSVSTRATALLRPAVVVALARAAAGAAGDGGRGASDTAGAGQGCSGPTLAVLVVDDDGLFVAVRDLDMGVGEVPEACETLLRLSPPAGPSVAVVVAIDPGFGGDLPSCAEPAWHEARLVFAGHGSVLADWLLVAGDSVVSVPRRFGEAATW